MKRSSFTRLATTVVVTGCASLVLAAPAGASEPPDPEAGDIVPPTASSTAAEEGWVEISIGALGGLVIAGAGIAAASGVRQRDILPTP